MSVCNGAACSTGLAQADVLEKELCALSDSGQTSRRYFKAPSVCTCKVGLVRVEAGAVVQQAGTDPEGAKQEYLTAVQPCNCWQSARQVER